MTAAGALAVALGRTLGPRVPVGLLRLLAAGLFTAFGLLLLVDALT